MRVFLFALAIACVGVMATTPKAEARPFWEEADTVQGFSYSNDTRRYKKRQYSSRRTASRSRGGVGPRPRKWCGWWMRTQLGGGPEFNLARNWRKYGRPAGGPRVGAVVVWPNHVGIIVGQAANGKWLVKSGNDGGQVRTRARSVSGAVFRIG